MLPKPFTPELIAPCGMNCGLCVRYLPYACGLSKEQAKRGQCVGCRARGKNCAFIKRNCKKVGTQQIQFCYECDEMPCEKLKRLDKGYQKRYSMSMIANLTTIRDKGMQEFLKKQQAKYRCPNCGGTICIHNQKCYSCN
ncbi:MAG: DUF3795 domain-containing protein [Candidatus Bathyarchaeota archaeon]|nr:DUF3795 domain-containing protein [Candidatus Bathyarchaeota archaeon]